MALNFKTLKNTVDAVGGTVGSAFRKLSDTEILEEGLSGKLMPYRFKSGVALGLVGASAAVTTAKEASRSYSGSRLGYVTFENNLDRLVSIDGSDFLNRVTEASGGDFDIERDIVKHTFDEPNQRFAHNNLVFALHNRRNG